MDFLCYLYTKVIITLKDASMTKQGSMRGRFQTASTPQTFFLFLTENQIVIIANVQLIIVIE